MRVRFDELHPPPLSLDVALHSLLHRANGVADVHRLCGGAPVHLHLRLHRGQECPRAQGHAAAAGHSAVGARAGISLHHGDRLPGAVSGQPARSRVRQHLRHLHGAGLEHDVRLLSLADHHSGRAAGSRLRLPDEPLAALHQGRVAVVGDRPDVELDDELRRRLVLRRAKRSHFGVEQEHQAARIGVVHGRGRRSGRHARRRLRDRRDDHHHRRARSAHVAAARRVGGEVQAGADRRQGQSDVVGAGPAAALVRAGLAFRARRRRARTVLAARVDAHLGPDADDLRTHTGAGQDVAARRAVGTRRGRRGVARLRRDRYRQGDQNRHDRIARCCTSSGWACSRSCASWR